MGDVLKIGLIGAAGLGKSTVANELSKEYDIVFLQSKEITRPILKKHGYVYGQDESVEFFLSKKDREMELVDERIFAENLLTGGFITDRTTLECFCYALLSINKYTNEEANLIQSMCRDNMSRYTHLFYFPYANGWFEENGIRTSSLFFQWKVDMLIRGVLQDWGLEYKTVPKNTRAADYLKSQI